MIDMDENCSSGSQRFRVGDYLVFASVLVVSTGIGLWYAYSGMKRKIGIEGYLLAKRNMHFIPVALSLTVSFMSAVTVLGTPNEVYTYGLMLWWLVPAFFISAVIIAEIYIPVFHRLRINSSYEYLEMRFNRVVRLLATVCFIIETIMYVGIVIYAPALALSEVTCFNLWAAVFTTGLVCTFYTTMGGLKAVIWTDVLQGIIMISGLLAVIIRGSVLKGGLLNIFESAREGGRIRLDHFDFDPRVRHSVWSLLIGGTMVWLTMYAVAQSQVQRYLCCKSERQSKLALYTSAFGIGLVISLACICGLVLYSFYGHCDLVSTMVISKPDRIMPYLVMDILGDFQGIPGLFVACVYSGSLSTISTGINAMAMVTVEDFIKPFKNYSDETYTRISKVLGVVFGLLCLAMAFLASLLGGVLQAALSIFGIVGGPLVGVYTMGLLFPCANSVGAIVGLASGLCSTSWLYTGAKNYRANNAIFARKLPVYYDQCTNYTGPMDIESSTFTDTTTLLPDTTAPDMATPTGFATVYSVSYMYYSCIGFAATLFIGLAVSLATGGWKQASSVNPSLVHFFFDHRFFSWLPESFRRKMRCGLNPESSFASQIENIPLNKMGKDTLEKFDNNNSNMDSKEEEITMISKDTSLA